MAMEEKEIIEYAKREIMKQRATGRTIDGRLLLMQLSNELRSKVSDRIRHSEGALEHAISRGLQEGLLARIELPKRPEDLQLTEEELSAIGWDVRDGLAKRGITSFDVRYHQEEKNLFDRLVAVRLAEKRAKLFGEKAAVPEHIEKAEKAVEVPAAEKAPPSPAPTKRMEAVMRALTDPAYLMEALWRTPPDPHYLDLADEFRMTLEVASKTKPRDEALYESFVKIAPAVPVSKSIQKKMLINFLNLAAKKRIEHLSKVLEGKEVLKGQVRKATDEERTAAERFALASAFKEIFPHPNYLHFKRTYGKSRKAGYGRGDALKIALERIFPNLQVTQTLEEIREKGILHRGRPFEVPETFKFWPLKQILKQKKPPRKPR